MAFASADLFENLKKEVVQLREEVKRLTKEMHDIQTLIKSFSEQEVSQ